MSSEILKKVVSNYEKLDAEWKKKNRNLQTCGNYLSETKVSELNITPLPLQSLSQTWKKRHDRNIRLWAINP